MESGILPDEKETPEEYLEKRRWSVYAVDRKGITSTNVQIQLNEQGDWVRHQIALKAVEMKGKQERERIRESLLAKKFDTEETKLFKFAIEECQNQCYKKEKEAEERGYKKAFQENRLPINWRSNKEINQLIDEEH